MSAKPFDLLVASDFKPRKPLAEKARTRLLEPLGTSIPKELEAFYATCNGGRIPRLSCRIYPLTEAVDLIGAYDFVTAFAFLPFFVDENQESDPCMVIQSGPLRGYLYYHPHDGDIRVLARTLRAFAQKLKQADETAFRLEEASFAYPKKLSAGERKTVERLLELSESVDMDEEDATLLKELAESMLLPEDRAKALAPAQKADDAFIARCIRILKKAGISAKSDPVYGLRVGPKSNAFNWRSFKSDQKRADFEEYLVGRIRYLFLEE